MKAPLFLLASGILLCGCASVGTNFDSRKLAEVKKGQTTEPQLLALFGKPTQRSVNDEGSVSVIWLYTEASVKGTTFIPLVGAFAGGVNSRTKTLVVRLDPSGTVSGYDFSAGGFSTSNGARLDADDNSTPKPAKSPRGQ